MATKKKPPQVPNQIITAAQAATQAKYGPEADALGQLVSQAMNTYSQSKGQANAAAAILGRIASEGADKIAPLMAANEQASGLYGKDPNDPGLGPASRAALAQSGALSNQLLKHSYQDIRDARVAGDYQIAAARRTRDNQLGQINQQVVSLAGQKGDYFASLVQQGLTEAQKAAEAAALEKAKEAHDAHQRELDREAGIKKARIGAAATTTAANIRAGAKGKGKGKGSGSGFSFLPAVSQSNAQQSIESTIKQINSMFSPAGRPGAQTRQAAAHTLLTGSPAAKVYDTQLDSKIYPPGSHVDQATGVILDANNQPLTYQVLSETGKPINKVRHARQITLPAIQPVKPIYVYAALDRLLYGGYREHTVKLLHNAGIKVGNVPVVPDAVALHPTQSTTTPKHGGTF